jgi:hypothetical protein
MVRPNICLHAASKEFPGIDPPTIHGCVSSTTNHANDAIRQRIEAAEMESFHTCDVCGQPGERREVHWIKTLCDEHASQLGQENTAAWVDERKYVEQSRDDDDETTPNNRKAE